MELHFQCLLNSWNMDPVRYPWLLATESRLNCSIFFSEILWSFFFFAVGWLNCAGDYLPLNPGEPFADVRVQFNGNLVQETVVDKKLCASKEVVSPYIC